MTNETNAVIQHISSSVDVLISETRQLRESHEQLFADFNQHRRDDRDDFNKVFTVIETNRQDRNNQFDKVIDKIIARLDGQDLRLNSTDGARRWLQGAGWVIIGIVGFLGAALLSALGVIFSHFWSK